MGNKKSNGRTGVRRAAALIAALGMLVLSSGVALMVTSTSANAANDTNLMVVVCKYVSTPGGQLDHIVVVADNTLPVAFVGNFPYKWTDAQGQGGGSIAVRYAHEGEQAKDVPISECPQAPPSPTETTATVTFTDPTCDVAAAVHTSGEGIDFNTSGTVAPGETVTVTATAQEGYVITGFAGPWTHSFPTVGDCGSVSPPVVPAAPTFVDPSCDNANTPSIDIPSSDVVSYQTDGTVAPGEHVTVTASANEGSTIAEGATTVWQHDFAAAATDCAIVSPPIENPPVVSPPKHHTTKTQGSATVTPSVVHAGLASATTAGLRSEQGLALVVAGMVMLLGAGGLGLRSRGATARF